MNPGTETVVSVMDVGGTHVSVANVDLRTRAILPGQSMRLPLDGDAGADQFVATLSGCAAHLPTRAGRRWAIALPGPFDYERGVAHYEGVGKFDALRGYDLRAALAPRLPGAGEISFCNDADAFAFGEWWVGAARGHRSVAAITLGTGVGSCFLRDGRPLRYGPGIPPEGRVNHLHVAGRPLEESISRQAVRNAYAAATGEETAPDVREIAQRARQGERVAVGVFDRTYRILGQVLGPVLADFGPEILVVGGSIAESWDLIAEPLRVGLAETGPAGIDRITLAPALRPAESPLLGAAYLTTAANWHEDEPEGAGSKA
jgi:glucokinase